MSAEREISTLRLELREFRLHLRAQREQMFIVEALTWDYKIAGIEVAKFHTKDEVVSYIHFLNTQTRNEK